MTKEFAAKENLKPSFPLWFELRRAEGTAMHQWRLVESKTLHSGTLALIYQPVAS